MPGASSSARHPRTSLFVRGSNALASSWHRFSLFSSLRGPIALQPSVEPRDSLVVPLQAVARRDNKVTLLWEDQESARDTPALQSCERRDPLVVRDIEILQAMTHEHRCPPLRNVQQRIVLLETRGIQEL